MSLQKCGLKIRGKYKHCLLCTRTADDAGRGKEGRSCEPQFKLETERQKCELDSLENVYSSTNFLQISESMIYQHQQLQMLLRETDILKLMLASCMWSGPPS